MRAYVWLLVLVAASGCWASRTHDVAGEARPASEPVTAGPQPQAAALRPAAEPQSPPLPALTVTLDVPGHEPAVLSLPESRRREPLLVAVHGAGDGPRWQCATFREIVGERGALLCPAGRSFGRGTDAHFHANHFELEKLVTASVDALYAAYPDRVDEGPAIYAAYSQGATMGALMLPAHAARFTTLVLIEGGYSEWNVARGLAFRKNGGQRVLFACGTRTCNQRAKRSAEWLTRAGVSTRVLFEEGAGHTYGGAVARGVYEAFDWISAGDPRWKSGLSEGTE